MHAIANSYKASFPRPSPRILRATALPVPERLQAGLGEQVREVLAAAPLRDHVSASPTYTWWVERTLALTGAWYEIFPRSEGARRLPTTATNASDRDPGHRAWIARGRRAKVFGSRSSSFREPQT